MAMKTLYIKKGVPNQGHKSKIFVFYYNNKYNTVKR